MTKIVNDKDDLTAPYEEWDLDLLSPDMWWHRFTLEKAFRILEKDKVIGDKDSDPAYNAIQQLIYFVLFSTDVESVKKSHEKLEELLSLNDARYIRVISLVCLDLISKGVKVQKVLRGKADLLLNYLKMDDPEEERMSTKYHAPDGRPALIASILGHTDDPKIVPILEKWWLNTDEEYSTMKPHRRDQISSNALFSLFEMQRPESFEVLVNNYNLLTPSIFYGKKQLIKDLKNYSYRGKLLKRISVIETDLELLNLIKEGED